MLLLRTDTRRGWLNIESIKRRETMDRIFSNRKKKVKKYTAASIRTGKKVHTLRVSVPVAELAEHTAQNVYQQGALADMLMGQLAKGTNTENIMEIYTLNDEQLGVVRLLTNPNPFWRTSDGRRIRLMDLDDNHLENIISYMMRRLSDIDLVGDKRTIEKQCITKIWLYKLNCEQARREKDKPDVFDDDPFVEELGLDAYDDEDGYLFGGLDNHW